MEMKARAKNAKASDPIEDFIISMGKRERELVDDAIMAMNERRDLSK